MSMESEPSRDLVILLGGPGAGKGAQAALLSSALGIPHIASGDLLRDHQRRRTPLGRAAEKFMPHGDLLPDELMSDIVLDRLGEPDAARGAILDGFPRTLDQAERLDRWLAEHNGRIRDVIYLDVPPEVLLERMAQRHRADDRPDVAAKRIEESAEDLPALREKYQARRIDGSQTIDAVHRAIMQTSGRAD
jgi:adenylate kinase